MVISLQPKQKMRCPPVMPAWYIALQLYKSRALLHPPPVGTGRHLRAFNEHHTHQTDCLCLDYFERSDQKHPSAQNSPGPGKVLRHYSCLDAFVKRVACCET